MTHIAPNIAPNDAQPIIGEPEVVEDSALTAAQIVADPAWSRLTHAAEAVRPLQVHDGSIPEVGDHAAAAEHVVVLAEALEHFAGLLPYDADYLRACAADFRAWAAGGFGVPDFYDSLAAFAPAASRRDGVAHLVVFPMYTQNGSPDRLVEAVVCEVIWPDFIAELEAGEYGNALYLGLRFADFTPGYDTNSAVLFPESVAVTPRVPWALPRARRTHCRPSRGERSSPIVRPRGSAVSCGRPPTSRSSSCRTMLSRCSTTRSSPSARL